jgi:hypothetical protein
MNFTRRQFAPLAVASVAVLAVGLPAIEGCTTPSWINTAISDLPELGSIVNSILSVVAVAGPILPPGVGIAAQLVQAGLTTLEALVADYKATPSAGLITKIDAALTDVQSNLNAILSAGHIDNVGTQALIATGVALAILVVQGIQALIPAPSVASPTSSLSKKVMRREVKVSMNTPVVLLTAAQIKASYNLIAVAAGYSQQQVQ